MEPDVLAEVGKRSAQGRAGYCRRPWRLMGALVAMLVLAAGCGTGGAESAGSVEGTPQDAGSAGSETGDSASEECTEPTQVRYLLAAASATLGSVGYLQVPQELGYFEEECLDVEVQFTTQGSSAGAVAALETGQADVSVLGTLSLISAVPEGVSQQAVFFTAFRNLGLFVLADGDVQSFADLGGGVAGANDLGTSAAIYCEAAAAEAGVAPDQWELMAVPVDEAAAAESLRTDRLDAWCGIDSVGPTFRNAGLDVVRLDSPIDETLLPPGALVFRNEILEEQPDVAVRMIRAIMKGMTFALEAPEKATAIAYSQYPESVPGVDSKEEALEQGLNIVQERMTNSTPPDYPERPIGFMTEEALEEGLDPWIAAGQYPEGLAVDEWMTMEFLEQAAEGFDAEAIRQQAEDYEPPDFQL